MPQTVKETLDLDLKDGNTLWAARIAKEMKNARVVFKILAVNESESIWYQKIPCLMVFDITWMTLPVQPTW